MTAFSNPLVRQIAAELDESGKSVDDVIVFVLERAAKTIHDRAFDDSDIDAEGFQFALRISSWIDPHRSGRD